MTEEEKIDKEELLKKLQEELERLSVEKLMAQMAANLATIAFKHLGLPPEENDKYKDLSQARLAIDGLDALTKLLESRLSVEEIQVLKTALSNLQLLYVKENQVSQGKVSSDDSQGKPKENQASSQGQTNSQEAESQENKTSNDLD
jgi:hypothetical protein